jgi:NRPS condensation-like uncharacterized protein
MMAPPQPLDLIPYTLRSISNQLIFVVLEFSGRINIATLKKAARRMYQAWPVLRCQFDIEDNRPIWRKIDIPALKIQIDEDITTILSDYSARIPACALQISVARHYDRDIICLIVDHAFADAAASRSLCYMLARSYSEQKHGKATELGNHPDSWHCFNKLREGMSMREMLRALFLAPIPARCWQFPVISELPGVTPAYEIRHLEDDSLQKLKKFGKRRQATINDLLLAAFSCALSSELRRNSIAAQIQFTVNLRRYLQPELQTAVANLSGTACIRIKNTILTSFESMIASISEQTRLIKQRRPGLDAIPAAGMLFGSGYQPGGRILTSIFRYGSRSGRILPMLTNLGHLDEAKLRFADSSLKRACVVGPNLITPGIMLSASGYANNLTLSTGYNSNVVSRTLIGRILDQMEGLLSLSQPEQLIGNHNS